jgi:hypothetical protein
MNKEITYVEMSGVNILVPQVLRFCEVCNDEFDALGSVAGLASGVCSVCLYY